MIDRLARPRHGRPLTGLFAVAQAWLAGYRPPRLRN